MNARSSGKKKGQALCFPFFQGFFFGGGWGVGVGDLLAIRYLKEITSTLLNSQLQPIRIINMYMYIFCDL